MSNKNIAGAALTVFAMNNLSEVGTKIVEASGLSPWIQFGVWGIFLIVVLSMLPWKD